MSYTHYVIPRYDNCSNCHIEHFTRPPLKNSVWQYPRLSYRILNPPYDITVIVIHLHFIFIIDTHTLLHIHARVRSVFQVFSSRTRWLLSSSIICLLVTLLITKSSRYSAEISRIYKPLFAILWTDYTLLLLGFEL